MKKIIVAMGLPGSGKSTIFKRLSEENEWPLISVDVIRGEIAGRLANSNGQKNGDVSQRDAEKELARLEADQSNNAEAWNLAYKEIAVLQATYPVILFDATLAQQGNRNEFIREVRRMGIDVIQGLYFTAPFSVVQERNQRRDRVVPEHAMVRMHEQLTIDAPSKEDGFDALVTISTEKAADEVYREITRILSDTINPELSKLR